jgi:hypothetical protein
MVRCWYDDYPCPRIHAPATNLVKAKDDVEQIEKEKFSSTNKVLPLEKDPCNAPTLLTCALIPHVSNQSYPIWFAQSSPFVIYISWPKGSHYIFS